jgi:hypothetical protein
MNYFLGAIWMIPLGILAVRLSETEEELNLKLQNLIDKNYVCNLIMNLAYSGFCNNNWITIFSLNWLVYMVSSIFVTTLMPIPITEIFILILVQIPISFTTLAISFTVRSQQLKCFE